MKRGQDTLVDFIAKFFMESLNSSLFKFKIPENQSESGSDYSDSEASFEADVLENLPVEVVRRVYALEHLQDKRQEIEALFRKELAVLEKKYEVLYEPLYEERRKIINGEREVSEEEYKDRESSHVSEEKDSDQVKGIPKFWLDTLCRSQLSSLVFEDDHEALEYLTNVKSDRNIDDECPKLVVSFEFAPNPFFTNSVLTKTVVFNATGDAVNEVQGSEINWKSGRDLCYGTEIKKLRSRSKPNITSSVEEKVHKSSFFHFFSEISAQQCDHDHDHDHEHDHDELEDQYGRMMADAEICSFIDKYIIPNAVDWYTRKAQDDMYDSEEDFETDEDEEDY